MCLILPEFQPNPTMYKQKTWSKSGWKKKKSELNQFIRISVIIKPQLK